MSSGVARLAIVCTGMALLAAPAPGGELRNAERAVTKSVKAALPAVVTVLTPNKRDFDLTGVVVGQGGVILTLRRPLLENGKLPKSVEVRFPGKRATVRAKVVASDASTQTVLLKAPLKVRELSGLPTSSIELGKWVVLLGNAFGQGREGKPTVSLGVVSGIVRDKDKILSFHASALVNPGSIGAPLVDLNGRLLGIVMARVTADGGQSVVVPCERVWEVYRGSADRAVAGLLPRLGKGRAAKSNIASAFALVVSHAARRARSGLVGVRRLRPGGTAQTTSTKKGEEGSKPPRRRRPRAVQGKLEAEDRCTGLVVSEKGEILVPLRIVGWPGPDGTLVVDTLDPKRRGLAAKVLGRDERLRVALLKVDAADLRPLPAVPRNEIRRGRLAVALGFPHSDPDLATPQVTVGMVSRLNGLGDLHPGFQAIQTDAAVNGGNRGGPLVDIRGRLWGMLLDVNDTEFVGYRTKGPARHGPNAGLGFALPPRVIERLLPRLREGRPLRTPMLGVVLEPAEGGVRVLSVTAKNDAGEDTTAKRAGLQKGDVITAIAGRAIRSIRAVGRVLGELLAGDKVEIRFRRAGKELVVDVELGAR